MRSLATIPAHSSIAIYSQLYLKKTGSIIYCKNKSKSTLRDNTGLVYRDLNGVKSYGQLLDVIIFEDSDYCGGFVTAISLHWSGVTICQDFTKLGYICCNCLDGPLVPLPPSSLRRCSMKSLNVGWVKGNLGIPLESWVERGLGVGAVGVGIGKAK